MPFVKVSRDKRGYEQIALMHVSIRRGKPSKQRVLYVFRTPPGVKIGREPFDAAIQRELEAQNPGIAFDWKALANIPIPAPDVEYWRERRKVDKAVKLARRAEEQVDAAEALEAVEPSVPPLDAPEELAAISEGPSSAMVTLGRDAEPGEEPVPAEQGAEIAASGGVGVEASPPGQRRAHRRGGRRRHRGGRPALAASPQDHDSRGVQSSPAVATAAGGPVEGSGAPAPTGDPSKLAGDASKEA